MNPKVAIVWAKWLAGMIVGAIVGIGKFPLDLTSSDWKNIANTVWLAAVPVIWKWANPKDELTFKKVK